MPRLNPRAARQEIIIVVAWCAAKQNMTHAPLQEGDGLESPRFSVIAAGGSHLASLQRLTEERTAGIICICFG